MPRKNRTMQEQEVLVMGLFALVGRDYLFTPDEIGIYLDVTKRHASRVLNVLVGKGALEVLEHPGRGRYPTNLYFLR